jgi:hypothetical protein
LVGTRPGIWWGGGVTKPKILLYDGRAETDVVTDSDNSTPKLIILHTMFLRKEQVPVPLGRELLILTE